jgi:mono/diheme cytochrome c family protein
VSSGVRAVVSMRSAELINRDSAVERLIEDRAIVAHINRMMEAGRRDPDISAFGQRTVGYWPMVIGEACAACHQRNGLNQQVGAFGGATIVIVGR